jgi:hypothetical protein
LKTIAFLFFSSYLFLNVQGQSFAPPPGYPGSTAIHKDSSIIINWAIGAEITRGYLNIQNAALGMVSHGSVTDAIGPADGTEVVSLGDSGQIVVTFQAPIMNGPGPDFAVFENGFTDNYMELAFVEASSDGINYFRFEAVSEAPTAIQLTNFSVSDCGYIYNLAGKYRANYGTPFDLEEMNQVVGLDVNNVTHIKLIDVIGSIDPLIGSFDSQNNIINDPYPTEFVSGGFDLDAIGVINEGSVFTNPNKLESNIEVFPNPSNGRFECDVAEPLDYTLYDFRGKFIQSGEALENFSIDISHLDNGIYYLELYTENTRETVKLVKI